MKRVAERWLFCGLLSLLIMACSNCVSTHLDENGGLPTSTEEGEIIANAPPFELTTEQLLAWAPNAETADARNRSTVKLAPRFARSDEIFDPPVRAGQRVLYAPDGMNNFGNYLTRLEQFNQYSFTQWSQIDILNWFASGRVSIPSRPWVEAAHRNGVKVIGTVFFAPVVYGGSSNDLTEFLVKDENGGFPAAHKLVDIAEYYGFDGWLMNQETDVPDLFGRPGGPADMLKFMKYLTSIAPEGMEIHWYDSMLESGEVVWQNSLTENNVMYLEDKRDASRASDAMFLNYWWSEEELANTEKTISSVSRPVSDIFWGVDLWPERSAQTAFSNTAWLEMFTENDASAWSIAMFAPNFNFNFSGNDKVAAYSDFASDPKSHRSFYATQNRLFVGDDANAASIDTGESWKGLGAVIPSRSTVASLPFETYFNTGHGLHWFVNGTEKSGPWHDMSRQSVQPSWQFAHLGGRNVEIQFDFDRAYSGGSSLRVSATPSNEELVIPLYRANIEQDGVLQLEAQLFGDDADGAVGVCLSQPDGQTVRVPLHSPGGGWQSTNETVSLNNNQPVTRIDLCISPVDKSLAVNLGMLKVTLKN